MDEPLDKRIDDYLEGRLDPVQARALEERLQSVGRLEELARLQRTVEALKRVPAEQAPDGLVDRIMAAIAAEGTAPSLARRLLPWALAATTAAAAALLLYFTLPSLDQAPAPSDRAPVDLADHPTDREALERLAPSGELALEEKQGEHRFSRARKATLDVPSLEGLELESVRGLALKAESGLDLDAKPAPVEDRALAGPPGQPSKEETPPALGRRARAAAGGGTWGGARAPKRPEPTTQGTPLPSAPAGEPLERGEESEGAPLEQEKLGRSQEEAPEMARRGRADGAPATRPVRSRPSSPTPPTPALGGSPAQVPLVPRGLIQVLASPLKLAEADLAALREKGLEVQVTPLDEDLRQAPSTKPPAGETHFLVRLVGERPAVAKAVGWLTVWAESARTEEVRRAPAPRVEGKSVYEFLLLVREPDERP